MISPNAEQLSQALSCDGATACMDCALAMAETKSALDAALVSLEGSK